MKTPLEVWYARLGVRDTRELQRLEQDQRVAYAGSDDWAIPERCRAAGYERE